MLLGGPTVGYGEGSSMEEARTKCFIERDIGRAGSGFKSIAENVDVIPDMTKVTPMPWELTRMKFNDMEHLCIVNHESKQVVCSLSPWIDRAERDFQNGHLILTCVSAGLKVLAAEQHKEK
jgi:hypothetical protein